MRDMSTNPHAAAQNAAVPVQPLEFPAAGTAPAVERSSAKGHADHRKKGRLGKKQLATARLVEEQCRRLGENVLLGGGTSARVLGFTSSVSGEGRTFLATVCASALARSSGYPVVLLECNWDHPTFDSVFGVPASPGLAEWLEGQAEIEHIRHQIQPNLTVIPAGNGAHAAARLIRQLQEPDRLDQIAQRNAMIVADLPPVLTCSYGKLAAQFAGAVVMVVRAGATQDGQLVQACREVGDDHIRGIVLNHAQSAVPGWLSSIL